MSDLWDQLYIAEGLARELEPHRADGDDALREWNHARIAVDAIRSRIVADAVSKCVEPLRANRTARIFAAVERGAKAAAKKAGKGCARRP